MTARLRWINRQPSRPLALLVLLIPFALVLLAYSMGSEARLAVNPADKLLPAPSQIAATPSGF